MIRFESTRGKKKDGIKPNQIGNTVGEKKKGKLTEEYGQGSGLQSTPAGTFNMPRSYQKRMWEREAHINWPMATFQDSTRLELPCGLLALCQRTLGNERHRYAIARLDKLGTDPMAYGGFKQMNGCCQGSQEESRK